MVTRKEIGKNIINSQNVRLLFSKCYIVLLLLKEPNYWNTETDLQIGKAKLLLLLNNYFSLSDST